ncbi:MAG: beta-propeller fold lactonase family protein [Candidatus Peregrinibacteria bacterium]
MFPLKNHHRLSLVTVVLCVVLAAVSIGFSRSRYILIPAHPVAIPTPFTASSDSPFGGDLLSTGTPEHPSYDVTFATNSSQVLSDTSIFSIIIPDDPTISDGVPLSGAFSGNGMFYGYLYTDANASGELAGAVAAAPDFAQGNNVPFKDLFSGTFFASDAEKNDADGQIFLTSYETTHSASGKLIRFLSLKDLTLKKNSRMIIVTKDATTTLTVRNVTWCGDTITNGTEQCEDGNAIDGDGCSSMCVIESGWTCSGTPSVCAPRCGNGILDVFLRNGIRETDEECEAPSISCSADKICYHCVCLPPDRCQITLRMSSYSRIFFTPNGRKAYVMGSTPIVAAIDTSIDTVVGKAIVGTFSRGDIALSPDGSRAYMVSDGSNSVAVIETAGDTVTKTIAVGTDPRAIALTRNGRKAFVVNTRSNTVSVIDTMTGSVTKTVAVGGFPLAIALTPDGRMAYVLNYGSDSVSVIATASGSVQATVPVGRAPYRLVFTTDGAKAYVVNHGGNTISVIDTASMRVITTVTVGSLPDGIAITPDGTKVYVVNTSAGSVSVIATATNTVTNTLTVLGNPYAIVIAATPAGTKAYVSYQNGDSISVIATASDTVSMVKVGSNPIAISVSPDGKKAYVANYASGFLSVIDTSTDILLRTCGSLVPSASSAASLSSLPSSSVSSVYSSTVSTSSVSSSAFPPSSSTSPCGPFTPVPGCAAGPSVPQSCIALYGESCSYCDPLCRMENIVGPHCGDGIPQIVDGEKCDAGLNNGLPGYCDATCQQMLPLPVACDAVFSSGGGGVGGGGTPTCQASGFGKKPLPSSFAFSTVMDLDGDGRPDIVSIGTNILTYQNAGGLVFPQVSFGLVLEEFRERYRLMMMYVDLDPFQQQKMMADIQDTIVCFQLKPGRTRREENLLYRYQVVQNFMQMDEQARGMELMTITRDITDMEAAASSSRTGIGYYPSLRVYDLDGDGDLDVLILSGATNGDILSNVLTRCINTNGAFQCGSMGVAIMGKWFAAVQLESGPELEVVVPTMNGTRFYDFTTGQWHDFAPFCVSPVRPDIAAICATASQGYRDLIQVADFNADGHMEQLSVISYNAGRDLYILIDGTSIARVPGLQSPGARKSKVVPVDMDNDGDIDIAGVAGGGEVFWFENLGGNSWGEHVIAENDISINVEGGTFSAVDLDGDYLPELYAPGVSGGIYTRSCRP